MDGVAPGTCVAERGRRCSRKLLPRRSLSLASSMANRIRACRNSLCGCLNQEFEACMDVRNQESDREQLAEFDLRPFAASALIRHSGTSQNAKITATELDPLFQVPIFRDELRHFNQQKLQLGRKPLFDFSRRNLGISKLRRECLGKIGQSLHCPLPNAAYEGSCARSARK